MSHTTALQAAMQEAAESAPNHPALRWHPANANDRRQHRRAADGSGTACGIVGPLELADTGWERCQKGCWDTDAHR